MGYYHGIMYVKLFSQIFDSSIAENYKVRHVFEDILKLADRTGCVDMTAEAIARRANCPLAEIKYGIDELCKPDLKSRSKEHEGRRLIPLDDRRDWGWKIVNYEHYRAIQDEEARRETWRTAKAKQRANIPARRQKYVTQGDLRVTPEQAEERATNGESVNGY